MLPSLSFTRRCSPLHEVVTGSLFIVACHFDQAHNVLPLMDGEYLLINCQHQADNFLFATTRLHECDCHALAAAFVNRSFRAGGRLCTVSLASTKLSEAGASEAAASGSALVALTFPSEILIVLMDHVWRSAVGRFVCGIIVDAVAPNLWCSDARSL